MRPSAMDGRGLKLGKGRYILIIFLVRPSAMDGRGLKPYTFVENHIPQYVRPSAMDGRGLKPSLDAPSDASPECARPPWTGED